MRYEKGHKDTSRQRIVETAIQQFKAQGIAGAGLKQIMAAAGLTNGAFYGHFQSKDALVRDSVVGALESQKDQLLKLAEEKGLEAVLRHYLSEAHRDEVVKGCPSAALLPEIGRQVPVVRDAYTERFNSFVASIAEYLPRVSEESKVTVARSIFGLAVGSLQLARAVNDGQLSSEILEGAVKAAMMLASNPSGA
jgi:TetR/AcrR family transcriptional repressor of nem operon